ncbi:MotE family protein [Polycladidibacter hongkongensis]|uniref:MotE family protein n=1 Tax=Polycladidibacter hongkongensis TaxID=1647556 RepID=UPI00082F0456|nr:hypothetical protein [Pseudovibrio hongkongensis]
MKLRLLPLVVFAGSSLLVLKVLSLTLEDKYHLSLLGEAEAQQSSTEVTPADASTAAPVVHKDGPRDVLSDLGTSVSERAVLSSLGKRRDELNSREHALELREQMLKSTEERINLRMEELQKLEKDVGTAKTRQKEEASQQIADLVEIYSAMKPKNAARIFDRLDMSVLIKVVQQMQPRKMADVLSEMDPAVAERLTIALASGGQAKVPTAKSGVKMLPKIKGN